MTKLINLESYLECCQYAHLFSEDPAKLIPNPNGLPLTYRDFCQHYQAQSFLPIPAMAIAQPKTLTSRKSQLPQQNIGLTLPDNSSEQIFIVREANSLVLRSLQSRYIYANVYRYWSYVEQLQQFTNSDKPLVIYDLDSFTTAQITPLTFKNYYNAPYPIPIIDTRSLKQYDALKLSQPYEKIYNSICLAIANKILQDLNLDTNNLLEVANYVKKINLFQSIKFTSFEHISLILEINHRFYSYNLSQTDLEDIIYRYLPIADLNHIIRENQNYNFVLLSSYIRFSAIKIALEQQFQNILLIPDLNKNNFCDIWKEKTKSNFALFGQQLDCISFFVKRAGEEIEIRLPDKICYEGEQEAIVYGQYEKDGKLEQNFSLKTKDVTLPFRINDEPFLDAETGVEQIYKIENQYFGDTPSLDVKICFRLKPSLAPKLEILDNYGRILNSKLIDREQNQSTLGCIPMAQIIQSRCEKSAQDIQILLSSNFSDDLQSFARFISINLTSDSILSITTKLSSFRSCWKNKLKNLRLILIYPDQQNLNSIYQSYSLIDKVLKRIFLQLTKEKSYDKHADLLLFLGDSYALTNYINLDFLFDLDVLSKPKNKAINWDKQIQIIAKISSLKNRQDLYLDLFNKYTQYREKNFYQTNEYIWGYARLLLWYININDKSHLELCRQHFINIVNHSLKLNTSIKRDQDYIRDALISLIYLLTFREIDPQFVEQGSPAYNQSKKLCEKLAHTKIKSQKANLEIPLNQFFEQLLDGSATQEQVDNMIEID